MKRLGILSMVVLLSATLGLSQIDIGLFAAGTHGATQSASNIEVAINPEVEYPFPPAAAEFNCIIYAPIAELSGNESFNVIEDEVNNGAMGWDMNQTFDYNGNRYFVFTYSGTGIDLSAYGSGDFLLAFTIEVVNGGENTMYCIADETSDIFTDFNIRTAINVSNINELNGLANPMCTEDAPLPVEFLNVSATAINKKIVVDWSTAVEVNNRGFTVQRLDDDLEFIDIGFVEANGQEQIENMYSLIDNSVRANRVYYYRIRQEDKDGTYSFSSIVNAIIPLRDQDSISLYPNPTDGNITIQNLKSNDVKEIIVMDETGRRMPSSWYILEDSIIVQTNDLISGAYYVSVILINGDASTLSFVIQ